MPPRKSKRVTRKTSRKATRKTSRKAARKTSRKATRKTSRKAARKTSRKATRKTSRKATKTVILKNTQNNLENKLMNEMKASGDAMNALGNSKHKLFFIDKRFYLIGTIKKIINLCANVLREKHFNRKSLADKITDPEFDKYKVSPSKIYFSKENVKRAFEIILKFLRENPGIHSSYNPYLEIKYKDVYYNMFQNMLDKENKEFEELENE
jgi:hypothetical protein